METNRCDIDETRKYLQGKMTPEEASAFEANLASDPQFREEFEYNKDLLESMRVHYKSELKSKLRDLESAEFTTKKTRSRRFFPIAAIAASVALFVVAGIVLLYNTQSPQDIFNEYYSPYYNVMEGGERSASGESAGLAMQLYDQERYADAIRVFEEAIRENPDDEGLQFYKALSHLGLERPDPAITYLEKISENEESRFAGPAEWYLGLAWLLKGDEVRARAVFHAIEASGNSYNAKAQEILAEME